jgi:hypothetical protein
MVLILSQQDYGVNLEKDGSFEIRNIQPGPWNLCIGNKFDLNRKYFPLVDKDNNLIEVNVQAGEKTDIGEIKLMTI